MKRLRDLAKSTIYYGVISHFFGNTFWIFFCLYAVTYPRSCKKIYPCLYQYLETRGYFMSPICFAVRIFLPNLQSIFNPNSSLLLWAAIAAFLGPFMARLFYSYACQILPVSKIVLLTPLAAIFTLFFQWILLGIGASLIEITGSAIVLVGIYTAIKYK